MNEELKNILEKVSHLYLKYGIKSVTMDDVARELGISKKTLYKHVKDKTDLVTLVVEYNTHNNLCRMDYIFDDSRNAIEELIEVNRGIKTMLKDHSPTIEYDMKKYYPDLFHEYRSSVQQHMYESIVKNIKKGKKEGLFREEMDEEVIAKLHVSRIMGMFENPLFTVNEFTSAHVFNEIFIYHIRGMANEKGLKFLEQNIDKL